jgi:hypothetical protein
MSLHDLHEELDLYRRLRVRSKAKPRAGAGSRARPSPPSGVKQRSNGRLSAATGRVSRAFYGTGEHVLAGDVDTGAFHAGKDKLDVNGCPFTYAELIAIGDLFETYDEMIAADPAELRRLQSLIEKSRRFYAARVFGSGSGGKNATDPEWQSATGGRYLKLAEDNFAHFAPSSSVLTPGATGTKRSHKTEWEGYHQRAIQKARGGAKADLMDALVINAFGDHFLTDAFAAGHLFNKDDINTLFKVSVLSLGKVNAAGKEFFAKVSKRAFTGAVKKAFSSYETVEDYLSILKWNPNIDSEDRFRDLLAGIAEVEPDLLGKSVVAKAIHDRLNEMNGGVPVTNNMGDSWDLTGDGTLDKKNLAIMQKAVKQSIANVQDAVTSTTAVAVYCKRVWDYTPQPTSKATAIIKDLIFTYTNPARDALVQATADLIKERYQMMLDELVRRKILKKA